MSRVFARIVPLSLVVASACSRETPTAAPAGAPASASSGASAGAAVARPDPAPAGKYATLPDGSQKVSFGDVEIEIASDLPQRPAQATRNESGGGGLQIVLRGWAIRLEDGKLLVAGRAFGEAPKKSVIRIAKDGVYVGSELRGALPP